MLSLLTKHPLDCLVDASRTQGRVVQHDIEISVVPQFPFFRFGKMTACFNLPVLKDTSKAVRCAALESFLSPK